MISASAVRLVASLTLGTLIGAVGACFDFDATIAGGPLDDGGVDSSSATDATTDGSPSGDAAHDGATADAGGDSSSGPFCASYPHPTSPGALFSCSDFDEGPLPAGWPTIQTMGGVLSESDAASVSPPSSLDETIQSTGAGVTLDVALRTPLALPPLPSTMTFAFSVDPVLIDTGAGAAIVLSAIDFLDGAGGRYSLVLSIQPQSGAATMNFSEQSGLADGGMPYVAHLLGEALALNTFTNIVITVDWTSATTAEAKVTVGGLQALDTMLAMTVQAASLQIGIGTSYVNEPSPGCGEIRYDNVVFTAM